MELVVQLGVLTFECKFEILPKKKLNFRKYQTPPPPKKKKKKKEEESHVEETSPFHSQKEQHEQIHFHMKMHLQHP